jgi:putative membrane protein
MMGYGMMGFGLIGMLFNLVVVVGVVVLAVWAVKRFTSSGSQGFGGQSPKDILQARYARGEITREQYQEMLKDLS